MSRLTRDGTAAPVSRDQILRHERGQENIFFPCLADHEQDWQPYPVDPYSCYMCDHTYIHNVGEKPTVMLYTSINRYAGTSNKTKHSSNKNLNAFRPFEHLPVRGENVKTFGRII